MSDRYPKKNMASGAIIINQKDEILIAKPNYKNYWHLPGGVIEENESPYNACIREVLEETKLEVIPEKLAVVHHSLFEKENIDALVFIFNCGKITEKQVSEINISYDELESYTFINPADIHLYLDKRMADITEACMKSLDKEKTLYMENMKVIL